MENMGHPGCHCGRPWKVAKLDLDTEELNELVTEVEENREKIGVLKGQLDSLKQDVQELKEGDMASLSNAQRNALNSGVTSAKVSGYDQTVLAVEAVDEKIDQTREDMEDMIQAIVPGAVNVIALDTDDTAEYDELF